MRETSSSLASILRPRRFATWANLPCGLQALLARQFGVRTGQMGPVSCRGVAARLRTTSHSRPPAPLHAKRGRPFHHSKRNVGGVRLRQGLLDKTNTASTVWAPTRPIARKPTRSFGDERLRQPHPSQKVAGAAGAETTRRVNALNMKEARFFDRIVAA